MRFGLLAESVCKFSINDNSCVLSSELTKFQSRNDESARENKFINLTFFKDIVTFEENTFNDFLTLKLLFYGVANL